MSSSKKVKEKRLFIFRRSRQRFPIHFPLECCCSRPWIIQHVYIPFSLVIFADVVDGSSSKTTNNGEDERKVRYTIHSTIITLSPRIQITQLPLSTMKNTSSPPLFHDGEICWVVYPASPVMKTGRNCPHPHSPCVTWYSLSIQWKLILSTMNELKEAEST